MVGSATIVGSMSLCLVSMQGIILVYDITNQKSFENITKWLQNIEMVGDYYVLITH